MKYALFCCSLVIASAAFAIVQAAQETGEKLSSDVTKWPDGRYIVTVDQGKVTAIQRWVISDDPTPPPPPPGPLSPTAKAVFDAVAQVDLPDKQETVADLSALLRAMVDQLEPDQLKQALPMAAAFFLQNNGGSAWQPVIGEISRLMGSCSSEDCKETAEEIVKGLEASSPDAKAAIDIETIRRIIEFILLILDLFQKDPMAAMDTIQQLNQFLQQ